MSFLDGGFAKIAGGVGYGGSVDVIEVDGGFSASYQIKGGFELGEVAG